MKAVIRLCTALLLFSFAFAASAEPPAIEAELAPAEAQEALQPADEAGENQLTPAEDCNAQAGALLQGDNWSDPKAAALSCGSCSSSNCQGATRGQLCWTGGVNGTWGHCNIYSGGFICPSGGWECSCGTGPLP